MVTPLHWTATDATVRFCRMISLILIGFTHIMEYPAFFIKSFILFARSCEYFVLNKIMRSTCTREYVVSIISVLWRPS